MGFALRLQGGVQRAAIKGPAVQSGSGWVSDRRQGFCGRRGRTSLPPRGETVGDLFAAGVPPGCRRE